MSNKGYMGKSEKFAEGGAVLGRTRDFMKEPDGADQRVGGFKVYKNPDGDDQDYEKGTSQSKGAVPRRKGSKELKTVRPRD